MKSKGRIMGDSRSKRTRSRLAESNNEEEQASAVAVFRTRLGDTGAS